MTGGPDKKIVGAQRGKSRARPSTFLGLWALVMAASIGSLSFVNEYGKYQTNAKSIAHLVVQNGLVQVRPVNFPLWSNAAIESEFREGDSLATGSTSSATIEFLDQGGRLNVEANSQVAISLASGGDKSEYIIKLLKGEIGLERSKPKPRLLAKLTGNFQQYLPEAEPVKMLRIQAGNTLIEPEGDSGSLRIKKDIKSEKPEVHIVQGVARLNDTATGESRIVDDGLSRSTPATAAATVDPNEKPSIATNEPPTEVPIALPSPEPTDMAVAFPTLIASAMPFVVPNALRNSVPPTAIPAPVAMKPPELALIPQDRPKPSPRRGPPRDIMDSARASMVWLDSRQQVVSILYNGNISRKNGRTALQWRDICRELQLTLLHGSKDGGAFSAARCEYVKDLDKVDTEGEWIISVDHRRSTLYASIFFQWKHKKVLVQKLELDASGDFLEIFSKNADLSRDLGRLIIEALPIGSQFVYRSEESTFEINLPPGLATTPLAPMRLKADAIDDLELVPSPCQAQYGGIQSSLKVFRFGFDPEIKKWVCQLTAGLSVQRRANEGDKPVYEVDGSSWMPLLPGQGYWAKDFDPEARLNKMAVYKAKLELALKTASALDLANEVISNVFASSYLGVRYGKSFLAGESVVTESSMVSVLLQMRSGILEGLRFYYDDIPKVGQSNSLSSEHFLMRRMSLGWAFDYTMPKVFHPFFSRIDFQPKIGLFNVDYTKVNALENSSTLKTVFNAKQTFDFGLELGIERDFGWMLNRLWASYNAANFGPKNPSGVSVVSKKAGVDAVFYLWGDRRTKFGILGFGQVEDVAMKRDPKKAETDDLLGIFFNMFFVGSGCIVSW